MWMCRRVACAVSVSTPRVHTASWAGSVNTVELSGRNSFMRESAEESCADSHYVLVPPPAPRTSPWRTPLLCLAFVSLAAAFLLLDIPHTVAALVQHASAAYKASPIAVANAAGVLLAIWIVGFLPTTLPELAIGFVFGLRVGFCVDYAGKIVGSSVSFLLGRSALRACVRRLLDSSSNESSGGGSSRGSGTMAELFDALSEEAVSRPFTTAFVMRAAYLPMPLKNYGAALLGITPPAFFAALASIEIVDTYLFIALGASASDLASLLRGAHGKEDNDATRAWLRLGLLAVAITATGVLLAAMGNVAMATLKARRSRSLSHRTESADEMRGNSQSTPDGTQSTCRRGVYVEMPHLCRQEEGESGSSTAAGSHAPVRGGARLLM